jgi:hypothetical protein
MPINLESGMEITVEMDLSDVEDIAKRQVPYVLARTLTDLGRETNEAVKRNARDQYMIRRPWMMKGFRTQGARKNFLQSLVYHRDPYMLKHERGDFVRSKNGKLNAVPQDRERGRNTRAMLALMKPNTFIKGRAIIKRKARSRRYELLFKLTEESRYAPTLKMEEIAQEIVNQKADSIMDNHWINLIE